MSVVNPDIGVLLVNVTLLALLFFVAIAIARLRSLFAIVMLTGAYSLISAMWFVAVDAVDVAFTEAAVGAGVSTVLMLGAMLLTARTARVEPNWKRLGPLAVCLVTGAVLIYATIDLPAFGDADSAANSHVGAMYLQRTAAEIDIPNVVTAVLASYRGFDTLGETAVVFAAGLAVSLLLGFGERSLSASHKPARANLKGVLVPSNKSDHHVVLRVVAKVLIPIVMIYALYVHFHGELSAGGGFQAGTIFAVAIVLYSLLFGITAALDAFPVIWARSIAAFGVLLYAGVGFWALMNGGNYLDYDFVLPPDDPDYGPEDANTWSQHVGIILIELGVLFAVAGSLISIFYAFAGRAPEIRDEDW